MATNFDKYYFKRFKRLENLINREVEKLFSLYQIVLSSTNRSNIYWNNINTQISQHYMTINKGFSEWNKLEIPKVYRKELLFLDRKIKGTKYIVHTSKVNVTNLINSRVTNQLTTALVSDSIASMSSALFAGRKNFNRLTKLTQQKLLQDFTVNQAVIAGIETGNIRTGINQLYKNLIDKLGDKKFVEVNGRNYNPRYYAELVTRTKFHEAQSFAARNTSLNYGTDLIRVSSHNTTTEICQQFEGKVYSISGKSKIFPPLFETSPFHPNCLHLMFPEFREAYTNKQLEQMSEFSRGVVSRPPFPAGFVPISDRKVA